MSGPWQTVVDWLERHGRVARVIVVATAGSTPREIGAGLIMRPDGGFTGTIGGGAFEWRLLDRAGGALRHGEVGISFETTVLGPDLGQCCGGKVVTAIEVLDRADLAEARRMAAAEAAGPGLCRGRVESGRMRRKIVEDGAEEPGLRPDGTLFERFGDDPRPLFLFGAGHVGRALVLALAPLPFRVAWIDGRPEAFPAAVPGNTRLHGGVDPVTMVATAPPRAFVLAMTHDHALDFAIADACLRRADLGFVGVIGSKTKRARFESRLRAAGHGLESLETLVCPIGAGGPRSKQPAVIAASVAVELLVADERERDAHRRMPAGTAAPAAWREWA